jgi:quaternary ammonium compound-resistance protein SugE
MPWIFLTLAGFFEVLWALGLKYSEGFTKLWPTIGMIIAMIFSLYFLCIAVKTLPLGTAYTVWTGIGAVGTVILGIIFFGESAAFLRLFCIGIIIAGIIGLKLVSGSE